MAERVHRRLLIRGQSGKSAADHRHPVLTSAMVPLLPSPSRRSKNSDWQAGLNNEPNPIKSVTHRTDRHEDQKSSLQDPARARLRHHAQRESGVLAGNEDEPGLLSRGSRAFLEVARHGYDLFR